MDSIVSSAVRRLPYWDKLSGDEKELVSRNAVIRRLPKNSNITTSCGDSEGCSGMIFVLSGALRTYIISDEGREITLFRIRSGDSCVLAAACVIPQISFDSVVSAEEQSTVLIVPSPIYGVLTSGNIYVRCFTFELATERFSAVMWVLRQILFERFDKRLAFFLLSEYKRTGSPDIRMTQEEVARSVNSAREVVARMLKHFAEDGLIENSRGIITIKDIRGLEAVERSS